jgi:hypothetical protein
VKHIHSIENGDGVTERWEYVFPIVSYSGLGLELFFCMMMSLRSIVAHVFQVLIFLTLVGPLAQAQEKKVSCATLVRGKTLVYLGFPEEIITKRKEGLVGIKAKVFLSHFETLQKDLTGKTTTELMKIFDELIDVTQTNYGGLTGVRSHHMTATSLVQDLSELAKFDYDQFRDVLSAAAIKQLEEEFRTNTPGNQVWANYYRNLSTSLYADPMFSSFFRKEISLPKNTPYIAIKTTSNAMTPTMDFRLYSVMIQREIMRRLFQNPIRVFNDMGIPYPKDERILMKSLEDLEKSFYAL